MGGFQLVTLVKLVVVEYEILLINSNYAYIKN